MTRPAMLPDRTVPAYLAAVKGVSYATACAAAVRSASAFIACGLVAGSAANPLQE